MPKYPELDSAAELVASLTAFSINAVASRTESEMPYKAQAILERVLELLKAKI